MAEVVIETPMAWNNSLSDVSKSLVFSVSEFIEQYLWGIPLCNPVTGQSLSDDVIIQRLLASQAFLESILGLKLFKQIIEENKDFVREEFQTWGFIKTAYQINTPIQLTGNLVNQQQIKYPTEWLSCKKSTDNIMFNELYVIPNGAHAVTFDNLAVNYSQFFSFFGARILPNYWKIKYWTGFDKIPYDLMSIIGKMAAVEILPLIEMVVGGASMFGLASSSLSLDGLSQSVSKANGGNIFQNRIKQYGDEVLRDLPRLRSAYVGIVFDVM